MDEPLAAPATLAGSLDTAATTRERAQAWLLHLHDYQPKVAGRPTIVR